MSPKGTQINPEIDVGFPSTDFPKASASILQDSVFVTQMTKLYTLTFRLTQGMTNCCDIRSHRET